MKNREYILQRIKDNFKPLPPPSWMSGETEYEREILKYEWLMGELTGCISRMKDEEREKAATIAMANQDKFTREFLSRIPKAPLDKDQRKNLMWRIIRMYNDFLFSEPSDSLDHNSNAHLENNGFFSAMKCETLPEVFQKWEKAGKFPPQEKTRKEIQKTIKKRPKYDLIAWYMYEFDKYLQTKESPMSWLCGLLEIENPYSNQQSLKL